MNHFLGKNNTLDYPPCLDRGLVGGMALFWFLEDGEGFSHMVFFQSDIKAGTELSSDHTI